MYSVNVQFLAYSFSAIQAHVVMVERLGDWMRYTINLLGMYKKDPRQTRRGETYVWVRYRDFKCKCPKLRKGRKYLIIGRHRKKYKRPGYVADRKTIVIRWRDRWQRRLRRFMRHERRGNCNSSGRKKRNRNWSLIEHSVFTEKIFGCDITRVNGRWKCAVKRMDVDRMQVTTNSIKLTALGKLFLVIF